MKKKFIAVLSASLITAGAIGGGAFASSISDGSSNETQQMATTVVNQETLEGKSNSTNYNRNSANNSSKDTYQDMVKLMRNNEYKDAARYMQTGDFEAMTDYMSTLSQEDFDQMIEIMNKNDYEYMGQMMERLGKDGMLQMHKNMGSMMNGF